jgi:hypothetical protein
MKFFFILLFFFTALNCSKKHENQSSSENASETQQFSSSQNKPVGNPNPSPRACVKYTAMIAQCPHPMGKGVREVDRYDSDAWSCGMDAFWAGILGKSGAEGCENFRCEEACS